MSTKLSTGRVPAIYEFIKANKDQFSVRVDVPPARRRAERLLRVALAPGLEPGSRGCAPASFDSGVVRGESRHLRRPRVFLDLREAGETCSKHRVAG